MGVWIEIDLEQYYNPIQGVSLPLWECGLKFPGAFVISSGPAVTPFMGVWIEILFPLAGLLPKIVTPFMGVWIEICSCLLPRCPCRSHSLYGSVD